MRLDHLLSKELPKGNTEVVLRTVLSAHVYNNFIFSLWEPGAGVWTAVMLTERSWVMRAYSSAGESARLISARSVVQIYLGPPKTGIRRFYKNFFGDIAQLGERRPCKAEVTGSIPVISTKTDMIFDN